MARKKKELAEEPVEVKAVEMVASEPIPEPKKEAKKPVRRARKTVAKKAESKEEKSEEKLVAKTVKEDPKVEEPKADKAKRGRKPSVKKTETAVKTEEIPSVEKEQKEPKEQKTEKKVATRAEKNETIRSLIKELLKERTYKWSELLEESRKLYEERIEDKDARNVNDVRGRIGSVFDVMKKDGEVVFDGGMYALKTENLAALDTKNQVEEQIKTVEKEEKQPQKQEEPPKKAEEKQLSVLKEPAKLAPVFDMSLLLGKADEKKGGRVENKTIEPKKEEVKQLEKDTAKKEETKPTERKEKIVKAEKAEPKKRTERKPQKKTEEKLKEEFLKKIRSLGGSYFEYYSVYLLERYSLKNGRRVDGLHVSGGDRDGGIDGEIEVTDRIGFRETIYIQAKNWNPTYGKQESWVIGETALQQFIGAVTYRQAKEGKQHCRGIFVTTSYFTAGAKEMLEQMSDKFVGYDADDLFEAAKECAFGVTQKDGQWVLDEKLLAGDKAFFNLY